MEHVSSVRPTGKFPEKVENLKRWSRFPGWNFRTECRVPLTFLVVCTSSRSTVGHPATLPRTGVYDQMEQHFSNRKFHFCYNRNFRVFFVNGKRPDRQVPENNRDASSLLVQCFKLLVAAGPLCLPRTKQLLIKDTSQAISFVTKQIPAHYFK